MVADEPSTLSRLNVTDEEVASRVTAGRFTPTVSMLIHDPFTMTWLACENATVLAAPSWISCSDSMSMYEAPSTPRSATVAPVPSAGWTIVP